MYSNASSGMVKLIAILVFSPAEQLVVSMKDNGRQSNGSDCGVLALALAFAYDIRSGNDPCKIKYDHRFIRQHLADCLEKCCLSHLLVNAGLLVSGTPSQWTITAPAACRGDKMAECDICKIWYTTSTAWAFLLTMINQRSPRN